jgi:hypothetical protein
MSSQTTITPASEEYLDISALETWLWGAACAIRGATDASCSHRPGISDATEFDSCYWLLPPPYLHHVMVMPFIGRAISLKLFMSSHIFSSEGRDKSGPHERTKYGLNTRNNLKRPRN